MTGKTFPRPRAKAEAAPRPKRPPHPRRRAGRRKPRARTFRTFS
jgi:hypothetical protein